MGKVNSELSAAQNAHEEAKAKLEDAKTKLNEAQGSRSLRVLGWIVQRNICALSAGICGCSFTEYSQELIALSFRSFLSFGSDDVDVCPLYSSGAICACNGAR